MLDNSYKAMTVRYRRCIQYLLLCPRRSWLTVKMSKRKRTRPSKSKEEQAATEGYVYVSDSKLIRGWNCVWVQGSREGLECEERTSYCPYNQGPTRSVPPG